MLLSILLSEPAVKCWAVSAESIAVVEIVEGIAVVEGKFGVGVEHLV